VPLVCAGGGGGTEGQLGAWMNPSKQSMPNCALLLFCPLSQDHLERVLVSFSSGRRFHFGRFF
jgi:hypothetical protein